MIQKLIGRLDEKQILLEALESSEPEMVAVFGRRRVGKTFLIKQTVESSIVFELTGLQNAKNADQLQNFSLELTKRTNALLPVKAPDNWLEAFYMLSQYISGLETNAQKKVVFFDEVPWLASQKSGFLTGLGWFWNSFAATQNLVVIICGSAASWMIQKIVNDRGSLHNRITKRIFLKPFTLLETDTYLKSRNIALSHYEVVQIYMTIGGIPHYLKEIKPGKSAVQNINDMCFSAQGLLRDEFFRLFPALFARADHHITIVRVLSQSHQGISRSEIVRASNIAEGGTLTKVLEELEQSGFITSYFPFAKKKKDMLFRLTDAYSLFFLRFVEKNKDQGNDTWQHLSQTQGAKAWAGYAFENVCLNHLPQIKKALGITGVYATSSSFLHRSSTGEEGAQIDLVLDRNDQIINLFEVKFYQSDWALTESDAQAIRRKVRVFQEVTGTRKRLMMSLITTFGVKQNAHSLGLVEKVLILEDLFAIA